MGKKVAYITGGSLGIGLGTAAVLLREGYRVAISGRNIESLERAKNELAKAGSLSDVMTVKSDVRHLSDEEAAVKAILSKWGQIDVCIANAGVGKFAKIDEMSAEDWNVVIDTNLTGVFHTVKACIPALKATKGYIITIASLAGTNFFKYGAAYNASKFGLVGFTQAVMLDLRPHEIKVSTIMPGSVATHFNDHQPNEADAWKIQPEDIGEMVADLLKMNPRTLPSKIEVRPSAPPTK
jgi:NADP-dependent 3-hydroxy acid dehydrogenase YdfG